MGRAPARLPDGGRRRGRAGVGPGGRGEGGGERGDRLELGGPSGIGVAIEFWAFVLFVFVLVWFFVFGGRYLFFGASVSRLV